MSINLTDELLAKTKKGKIASAKQVFLEGDQENLQKIGDKTHQLEDAIKDITVTGGASTANAVSYNNETSGMTAVTAQGAIDELAAKNTLQDDEIAKKANSADVTSQIQNEQSRVNGELSKKFDKESILQESGKAEDKVMSQKAVSTKLSNLYSGFGIQALTNFIIDKSKITTTVGVQQEQGGLYSFGQNMDEEPAYKSDSIQIQKAEFSNAPGTRPQLILLESCQNASIIYRSYAIFDKDNNLIKEGIASGDFYLVINTKCTIIASCSAIKSTEYGSYSKVSVAEELAKKFDNTSLVNGLGEADDKFLSQSALNKSLRISTLPSDIIVDISAFTMEDGVQQEQGGLYIFGQKLNDSPFYVNQDIPVQKATFTFTPGSVNKAVLLQGCKMASYIYRSYAIYDKDGNIIKEGVVNGNIVFIINSNCTILASCNAIKSIYYDRLGIESVSSTLNKKADKNEVADNLLKKQNNNLLGKTIWTLCDSLGANTWQKYLVEESGCIFHSNLNLNASKPISQGGSSTYPNDRTGGQARAINLVSYKDSQAIDYVIIENVNDSAFANDYVIGNISDFPFMRKVQYTLSSGQAFSSRNEAKLYFDANFNTFINTFGKQIGSMISIPYTNGDKICGSKIEFLTRATSEGDISIVLSGTKRSIHVTQDMTIKDIKDGFLIWSFGSGWSIIDNGDNSVSIVYYTETNVRATFESNGTGVTVNVEDAKGTGEYTNFFMSKDLGKWNDKSYWKDSVSIYSMYKGLVEYLKSELPNTQFYWLIPFAYSIDFSSESLKNEDGSYSQYKFTQSSQYSRYENLYKIQTEICKYYGIPIIDLRSESSMSIYNMENFFYSNNLHPKDTGYKRYADTIYRLMK